MIVESPSKCGTISKILNAALPPGALPFLVQSSNGHICDLPQSSKQVPRGSTNPNAALGVDLDNGYRPLYVTPPRAEPVLRALLAAAKRASEIYLATDPDREGESIAAHLQAFFLSHSLSSTPIRRVSFSSLTPDSIGQALDSPTDVDGNLVAAQEARRVLDRLAGYTMSPLLWKKIAPGLSAGRVQTVGLNVVVERELRRLEFKPAGWHSVELSVEAAGGGGRFNATLAEVGGARVVAGKDLDERGVPAEGKVLLDAALAAELSARARGGPAQVASLAVTRLSRSPPAPYITSTLQQDANSRLGMPVADTMRHAQALYEGGWISYMRTDNRVLGKEAGEAGRREVGRLYGEE